MHTTADTRKRHLVDHVRRVLTPALITAAPDQRPFFSLLPTKAKTKGLRVVNWSVISEAANLNINQAALLPLLVALAFPECVSEHIPHVMACLLPYADYLFLPNFPVDWKAVNEYILSQNLNESEELQWRAIGTAVRQFYTAFHNSRKARQAIIKRFESFFKSELLLSQNAIAFRKEGLLGKEDDRVTVLYTARLDERTSLTQAEIAAWTFERTPAPTTLPTIKLGDELLQLYNGYFRGVYHVENYVLFHLPVLAYDVLSTGDAWSLLPESSYGRIYFRNEGDFANHYVTFRDVLHANFDRVLTEINPVPKARILKEWCDKQLPALESANPDIAKLLGIPKALEKADRVRVVNTNDLRKKIFQLSNRKYIKAPPEKRAARKALLKNERQQLIELDTTTQLVLRCAPQVFVTARHDMFYVEFAAVPEFNKEQRDYFGPRVKIDASRITIDERPYISLNYLAKCHELGRTKFDGMDWITVLLSGVHNALAKIGITSYEDWTAQYAARLKAAEATTGTRRHTTFTKDDDAYLWERWKRYQHDDARNEIFSAFPQYDSRHVTLRGRLMSQIRRKNKPIEFLYDIEGLKKFLGTQFATYSAVIG